MDVEDTIILKCGNAKCDRKFLITKKLYDAIPRGEEQGGIKCPFCGNVLPKEYFYEIPVKEIEVENPRATIKLKCPTMGCETIFKVYLIEYNDVPDVGYDGRRITCPRCKKTYSKVEFKHVTDYEIRETGRQIQAWEV